jgi:hypothetical protein
MHSQCIEAGSIWCNKVGIETLMGRKNWIHISCFFISGSNPHMDSEICIPISHTNVLTLTFQKTKNQGMWFQVFEVDECFSGLWQCVISYVDYHSFWPTCCHHTSSSWGKNAIKFLQWPCKALFWYSSPLTSPTGPDATLPSLPFVWSKWSPALSPYLYKLTT